MDNEALNQVAQSVISGQYSFDEAMKLIQRTVCERALNEADGNLSTAARRLGMKHQTFIARLAALKIDRKPIKKRYRHLIDHSGKKQ